MRNTNKFLITTLAAAAALASAVTSAEGQLKRDELQLKREEFILPAQPLGDSLRAVGNQADVNVLFDPAQVERRFAPAIKVSGTVAEALTQLLAGSGLTPRFLNEHTVVLDPSGRDPNSTPLNSSQQRSLAESDAQEQPQRYPVDYLRLAQAVGTTTVESTSTGSSKAAEQGPQKDSARLEEVVVTAEKREERLQDVPVPVTVLSGVDLAENNKVRLQDYFSSVPGLSVARAGQYFGGQSVEIRGLSTSGLSFSTPTVTYMIDESIIGSSQQITDAGEPSGLPDIDPSDIERIEVLKGPQGTLYGADGIGGVIKVVTKDPSMERYSAHVQVLGEDISDGGTGYAVRASANIPVTDQFAVRVSAFDRRDAGYIEDVTSGQKNVNSADVYGTHISALFRPMENLSLKVSGLLQNDSSHGNGTINVDSTLQPTLGDLQQTGLPGSGGNLFETRALNGTLKAQLAGVSMVSATGYDVLRDRHQWDFSSVFGAYADKYFPGNLGATFPSDWKNSKFTQELRFSSSYGHWLDWLVGGFYTHESNSGYTLINANNAVTGAYAGTFYTETAGLYGDPPTTFAEQAIFGDLTFHITDRFDIQLGGRESWNQQAHNHKYIGPGTVDFDGAPSPVVLPTVRTSGNAFTYLVTPEYKFSPDLMVYARVASGYQVGGTNADYPDYHPPSSYGPSTTTNYEIGTKGRLYDGRVTFDMSAYYISWKDIQVNVQHGFDGYTENAGHAKSQGLELSWQAHPIQPLRLSLAGSYNDAALTSSFPTIATVYGAPGTQLPYSMHFSGSFTADVDVLHFADKTVFIGATASYIDKRYGEFPGAAGQPRLIFPAYTTVDAHTGVRLGAFTVNLYVHNLGNERGIVGGASSFSINNVGGYYASIVQPRTMGLSLSGDF